ncbi:MAG: hypothetical protein ACFFD2_13050 [Promethearchaeota archaeon]
MAHFYSSWERRRELTFGGDYRNLAEVLSSTSSWSIGLVVMEDFQELVDLY